MSFVAKWMARRLWIAMLWLMRRPWMKTFQRRTIEICPPRFQESAKSSQMKQNRFARRIGLPMLTVMMNLVLASLVLTLCFEVALNLYESGYLTMPRNLIKS